MYVYTSSRRGFTLLELLVVIALIGLLSAVVLVSLGSVRSKSRDARRMSDINQIQRALALYATNYNIYPAAATAVNLIGSDTVSQALISSNAIPAVSSDPLSPDFDYAYQTNATANTYTITFCLETNTIPNYSPGCTNTVTP